LQDGDSALVLRNNPESTVEAYVPMEGDEAQNRNGKLIKALALACGNDEWVDAMIMAVEKYDNMMEMEAPTHAPH